MIVLKSFLLNVQFFTTFPIRKELSMGKEEWKWMVRTFPILGFSIGVLLSSGYLLLAAYTPMSTLALSFYIWVMPILISGGLHLDGYMDASDAYFSYRDQNRRLDIMKDPRIGAFGVLSVLVLLSSRFLFIYETLQNSDSAVISMVLVSIPILSRLVMGACLVLIPPAQNSGMGYSFSKHISMKEIPWLVLLPLLVGVSSILLHDFVMYSLFFMVTIGCFWFIYLKTIKWFGGMTGDTVGASVEGVEWILWMTIWLLQLFDMV
ncbi:adenosylcobinamide-GDP ribazoletransferase [Rossellomorea sp. NPDC077527]|uniref:adenosylcobinamide-GDP ribazoletransferase n=1 Tax=Rossellomorea sp. NPDC077527 TaxID=3364510 RepID=UPI0037C59E51